MSTMKTTDLAALKQAHGLLHTPSLAIQAANLIGKPIEIGLEMLPEGGRDMIMKATRVSLEKATDVAISTLGDNTKQKASPWWHKAGVAASGAVGGAFGMGALAVELPISTVLMLRSIGDIARAEGEDITNPQAQLECLTVFALGGETEGDDNAETGYYAARYGLARAMAEAVEHLARNAVVDAGSPILIRFITQIAERFSIQVSEKVMVQAIPVLGAIGGATINTLFIDHFQNMARGHFIVRRLERQYGPELVQKEFNRLSGFTPTDDTSA